MMISPLQVRRVIEYLRTPDAHRPAVPPSLVVLPPRLLERVADHLAHEPELRLDRVLDAQARLWDARPGADEVAERLLARELSDTIR